VFNSNNVASEGEKIVEHALTSFGRCDVLINNAGNLRDKSFTKMTKEDWHSVMDVHLNGTFQLCHALWPLLQQQQYGRIINIGSGAGLYGNFGQANYSSAKMGILGLTQTLAKEGVSVGITLSLFE
jgi:multifunctional beta-oxidation protein